MQLKLLLSKLATRHIRGPVDVPITSICYDSREARPGAMFVAMAGSRVDGHDFIGQAAERGASVIVLERDSERVPASLTCVEVDDSRIALASLAAFFYHQPSHKLKTIGITGTNGKTTTAYLMKHICDQAILRCGLIGTVRYEIGNEVLTSNRTTPESLDLQMLLAQMKEADCKAVVMEVSSHAISQHRVHDVEFDAAVFTNLTQDHLDFHGDLQTYFNAKSSLFTEHLSGQAKKHGSAIINIDDRYGAELRARLPGEMKVLTYGVGNRADFRASNIKTEFAGTSYQLDALDRSYLVRLPLIGKFNVYNSLAALAAASAIGIPVRASVLALATAPSIPGRVQLVPAKRNYQVYVDYAHTDDALHNVLRTLRELNPNRLIVVFGCGGDRDKAKRPLMGRAAEQWADHVIITSDNPRSEDPDVIAKDIGDGLKKQNHEIVLDRRAAIERAVSMAQPRDIILIAGKGHETYQEFAHKTIDFDDIQVARLAIEARPVELV